MEKELQKKTYRSLGIVNPRRFLRYLAKVDKEELVLTKILVRWENTPEGRNIAKGFPKRKLWPKEKARIIKIAQVLITHYEYPIHRDTVKLARKINKQTGDTIEQYLIQKKQRYLKYRRDNQRPIITHTPEEALQEQIAQGFIKVQDYKEYNPDYRHCYSLVNKDYIYPYNFSRGKQEGIHIIRSLELVGISGFTRITQ